MQSSDPVRVYLGLAFVQSVCFSLFFTVQLVYHATVVGLDPLQMILVGTVLEIVCFVFEVPTGVVADVYSRRLSVLVGLALMGCSYTLEGGVAQFWAALVSQVLWGLGYTFTSGAHQAWITDEVGEAAAGPVFLRYRKAWLLGGVTGTVLAAGLALVHIQLPMVFAGAGMFVLVAALAIVMPERHMHVVPRERSAFRQMAATAGAGLRLAVVSPVVRVVVIISLVTGLAAEAYDRLAVPSVIGRFELPQVFGADQPAFWFALSGLIGMLISVATAEVFGRRYARFLVDGVPARLLAGLSAVDIAALVVFAVCGYLWLAFAMMWVRRVLATIIEPVQTAWLSRGLEPTVRATVLSMAGQANSIGQAAGGPVFGVIGTAVSLTTALVGSAGLLTPIVALYGRFGSRVSLHRTALRRPALRRRARRDP
jgi:MFS transporter, DHA3 family, tetracycline resistance protein